MKPTVAYHLSVLGYRVGRGLGRRLAPLELEPRQFGILNGVAGAQGSTQQALASRLQIPPSRVVAILDELEERGVVERRAHPSDRRARAIHLTPTGQELLRSARKQAAANEAELLAPLEEEERQTLAALLAKLAGDEASHPALRD